MAEIYDISKFVVLSEMKASCK